MNVRRDAGCKSKGGCGGSDDHGQPRRPSRDPPIRERNEPAGVNLGHHARGDAIGPGRAIHHRRAEPGAGRGPAQLLDDPSRLVVLGDELLGVLPLGAIQLSVREGHELQDSLVRQIHGGPPFSFAGGPPATCSS